MQLTAQLTGGEGVDGEEAGLREVGLDQADGLGRRGAKAVAPAGERIRDRIHPFEVSGLQALPDHAEPGGVGLLKAVLGQLSQVWIRAAHRRPPADRDLASRRGRGCLGADEGDQRKLDQLRAQAGDPFGRCSSRAW